jgi:hypothetical protein
MQQVEGGRGIGGLVIDSGLFTLAVKQAKWTDTTLANIHVEPQQANIRIQI